MSKNKELGQEGEQLAADYLKKNGWKIQETNYRYSRSEIDLIASKNDLLIFVEVKTRTNTTYGLPEHFVDEKKAENIMKAAEHYIREHDWKSNIRFDIISIIKKVRLELEHIEDAFY
ncbi:MAG: YraN family protein [Cyclobacteriaceae bacterium]|nr:YraN family protein [Cyclobacteriaceae bacterium]